MKSIKSTIIGISKIFFGSGLSQLLNFALVIVVTRMYGDSILAYLVKVIALSSFLVLFFEVGCNYLIISRSHKALKDILRIRLISWLLISVGYFAIFSVVKYFFTISFDAYFLCYIFSLLSSISNFFAYYYQGRGNIDKYAFSFFGRNSIHFLMTIIIFYLFKPIDPISLWLTVGAVVNVVVIVFSLKDIDRVLFSVRLDRTTLTTFRLSCYYLMSSLLVMVIIRAEAILLRNDDSQLAIYFQAKTFALAISLISSSFSNYYLSNFNMVLEKGWRKFRNHVLYTYVMALPLLLPLFFFSDIIFHFLYSGENAQQLRMIFTIVGFAFSLGIITNSLSTLLIKAEVSKVNFYLNFFQMALVIVGGYLLVDFGIGALGVSIAVLMAHVSGFVIIFLYTERKHDLLLKKIMD